MRVELAVVILILCGLAYADVDECVARCDNLRASYAQRDECKARCRSAEPRQDPPNYQNPGASQPQSECKDRCDNLRASYAQRDECKARCDQEERNSEVFDTRRVMSDKADRKSVV